MRKIRFPPVVQFTVLAVLQIILVFLFLLAAARLPGSGKNTVVLTILFCSLSAVLFGFIVFFHAVSDKRARKKRLLGEFASEINRAILLNEDEDKVFSTVLDYAFRIVDNVELGSILAFSEPGVLGIKASQGFSDDFIRDFRLPLEDSYQYRQSGGKIFEGVIISEETIKSFQRHFDFSKRIYKSVISVPLFVGGELYGFLNVDSEHSNNFGPEDLDLLKNLGAQIEVCLLARERYRSSLEKSYVDSLTGFYSRAHFERLFKISFEQAKRGKGKFVIGMFDVDELKRVNDTLGHQAGDLVLKTVSAAIKKSVRTSDVVGRYGGDEFIGLYFNTTSEGLTELISRITETLRATPVSFAGKSIVPSFSFGFADYPADAEGFEGLVDIADGRLYAMKAERKNRA